jgi:hypothetical protein
MDIENLTKYFCVYSPTKNFEPMVLSESPLGEYVKFEEVVEVLQKIKAEIATTVSEIKTYKNKWWYHGGDLEFKRLISKLERQLSAV